MKKKLLALTSVFLVVCMLITAFPIAAAGADRKEGNRGVTLDDNMNVSSTNSLGKMIEDEIGAEQDEQESNNGINVISVEVEGNTATAEVETTRNATLVVGIYSEDTSEMYASGNTEITPDDDTAQVTIETDSMPQYFYLKAYIVDTDTLKPLCSVYESPNYTQEMQEFLAKTTDDFEQDRVLNFDDAADNNFAVYNDDVTLVEASGEVNNMASADEENFVYVIENADESILSLSEGQVFSYEYKDTEKVVIVKVKSIAVDGTTATIEGEEIELEEVFNYFKIDTEKDETSYSSEGLSEGLEYVNDEPGENGKDDEEVGAGVDYEGELKKTHKFIFGEAGPEEEGLFGKFNVEGGFEYSFGFKMKIYLMPDEKYVELKLEAEGNFDLKFKYKATGTFAEKKDIPIGKIVAPLIPAVVSVSISPSLVCEVNGEIELKGKITTGFTFKASSQTGAEFKTDKPKFTPEIKVEAKVFIGLDLKPELDVFFGVFSIDVTAKLGAEVSAEMKWTSGDDSFQHDCSVCLSGEIYLKAELSGKVKFLKILEPLTGSHGEEETDDGLSVKLMDLRIKIADFYWSGDYGEFGFTTCPHKRYKLDITVYDYDRKPLNSSIVTVSNTNVSLNTDSSGKAYCYLPNGDYTVTAADANNFTAQNKVKIYGKSNGVLVNFNPTVGSSDKNDIISVEAGYRHSAALTRDGTLYMWGCNEDGQIGDGTTVNRNKAVKINSANGLPEHSVKQVSLGITHSAAVTYDGKLYLWGDNSRGQLGNGTTNDSYIPKKLMDNVKMASCGASHSAALTADGSLYMWGNNDSGQVGNGTTVDCYKPVKIMDNVRYVTTGPGYCAAITNDNSLYTWGSNNKGQLGNGTTNYFRRPHKIMNNIKTVNLSKTGQYGVAKDFNDSIYIWGDNNGGVFGNGTTTGSYSPVKIFDNVFNVGTGGSHIGVVTKTNDLYLWGYNNCGQLSNGGFKSEFTPSKKLGDVLSCSCGSGFTLVLTVDGKVMSCGRNEQGQLGSGNLNTATKLKEIELFKRTAKQAAPLSAKSDDLVGAGTTKTVTFNGYKPNAVYNFYSLKNKENGLQSDNLLYISQVTPDENGSVTITYTGTDFCDNPAEFLESLESFDINDLSIENAEYTYNGTEQYFQPVIKNSGYELCEGIDYSIGGAWFATDVGEYTVVITGDGDYVGSKVLNFDITKCDIGEAGYCTSIKYQSYTGEERTPEPVVICNGRTLIKDVDYTVGYNNNTEVGEAQIIITGIGNFSGTLTTDFEIIDKFVGDTNLDGIISIGDVTAIQRHLAELAVFNDEQLALADTNGDGKVDISDATHLQKYLAQYEGIILGKS